MRVVVLLVVILVLGYVISRVLRKRAQQSRDNYICDVCGEHECLCHKEDKGT